MIAVFVKNKKFFIISDIHGKYDMFEKMLGHWNKDTEQLIILGDLIDRGEDSLKVVKKAMTLKDNYGAIILMGNHEDMFLSWLREPHSCYGEHIATLRAFNESEVSIHRLLPEKLARLTIENNPKSISFLKGLPDYVEADNYIFVHAGVDLSLDDWKDTYPVDFKWIREPFLSKENKTGKRVVFGHTPTPFLNEDKSNNVWVSSDKTKIGIDGGAVFKGVLHGLRIDDNEVSAVSITAEGDTIISDIV